MYGLPASGKTTLAMKLYKQQAKGYNNISVYKSLDKQEDFIEFSSKPTYGFNRSKDLF